MQLRRLGAGGPVVSALGLGCMGMSHAYGRVDDASAIATLVTALDAGVTLFDTADVYGDGHNERLLAATLPPGGVVVATKVGMATGASDRRVDGRPASLRTSCEASLRRLGRERIELCYLHRVDPDVPIEESVGTLAALVHEGKVGHIGLSEASVDSLERASAVHPIAALQVDWSLWSREVEAAVVPAARRLGIGVVAHTPLGRGFLTGHIGPAHHFGCDDLRHRVPRLAGAELRHNTAVMASVASLAVARATSPAQLALAWLLAQGDDVVPIPGASHPAHLVEDLGAVDLELGPSDLARLQALTRPEAWQGALFTASSARPGGRFGTSVPL
jgi:aryl-alcohol dehydrogenase-like predicted oxidoreductase